MQTVKLDSINYTYTITRTAKTSYEQREEAKEERRYMIMQKLIAIVLIMIGVIGSAVTQNAGFIIVCGVIGVMLILTKEHVICL